MKIKWVPASEISGATPEKAGGIVAIITTDLGAEQSTTAVQYRALDHATAAIFNLWKEIRFLQPIEIHPDDYRALYPEQKERTDAEIKANLAVVQRKILG